MAKPTGAPVPKDIILCFDGTNNEVAARSTNVLRIFNLLNPDQRTLFYDPGVGTLRKHTVFSSKTLGARWRRPTEVWGLAFGYGMFENVREGYSFLVNNYVEGDRVYLFGFSRGAYTARVLVGMLGAVGLLRPGTEHLYPYAFNVYCGRIKSRKTGETASFGYMGKFKKSLARRDASGNPLRIPIHYLGLWDSVSSVGWASRGLRLPWTDKNPNVRTARHALALDEQRGFYLPPPIFAKTKTQDYRQVWFAGVHSDVGGGYNEKEGGLGRIALEWILNGAIEAGLQLDADELKRALAATKVHRPLRPPLCTLHQSLTRWWHLAELVPRKIYRYEETGESVPHDPKGEWGWRVNRWRRRPLGVAPIIHESAFILAKESPDYLLPTSLPARYEVEPWRRLGEAT